MSQAQYTATVTWPTEPGVTAAVKVSEKIGTAPGFTQVQSVAPGQHKCDIGGIDAGTTVSFLLQVADANGNLSVGVTVTGTAPAADGTTTPTVVPDVGQPTLTFA
jgi:hypothetical protein